MSRMTKTLKAVHRELQSSEQNNAESPLSLDISSIEKASFFQGNPYSPHGNPLHSTALEDDPSAGAEPARSAGKPPDTRTDQGKTRTLPKKGNKSATSKENRKPPSNQAAVVRKPLPVVPEARDETDRRRTTAMKAGAAERGQRSPLSSEEITDDDQSFHPSMKKSRGGKRRSSSRQQSGRKHKRKSSSSSAAEPAEKAGPVKKPRGSGSPSDLDVVLDSFQEFVSQYKQTITSDAVRRSIDAVSRSFEEQLSEIITATNELKRVKRENNKINAAVNQKRSRLVDASNEIIRAKSKLGVLQKEHDGMELRLRSLREGSCLLSGLQELSRKYRQHRTDHPEEEETYGPSCMPAMLMEARCIMGTEHQLKTVNDNLEQVLDQSDHQ